MLPILHLNGYKIAGPTVLGRVERRRGSGGCSKAMATRSTSSRATTPTAVHAAFAATLDNCYAADPGDPGRGARRRGVTGRPRWPAIVLRTPKGWTGPKVVDGVPVEGTFRAHQVPLAGVRDEPASTSRCSRPGCGATGPEELFDEDGRLVPELAALAPRAIGAWARIRTRMAGSI